MDDGRHPAISLGDIKDRHKTKEDNQTTSELRYTFTETVDVNGTPQTVAYSADFTVPGGIKGDLPLSAVPAPAVQVAVGLPFKLDVIVRATPKVGSDDVKGSLFGFGLKKEITGWFGKMDKTPLHVSLLAAYSTMNVDYEIGSGSDQNIQYTDAAAEFKLNSYTIQAIASLNFPVINFYGGVGFNGGKSTLDMLGDYTLSYDSGVTAAPTYSETITNPFSIKNTASGVNATIGTRLSLGFFKIFGSYTLQEYNSINGGIAFSFR